MIREAQHVNGHLESGGAAVEPAGQRAALDQLEAALTEQRAAMAHWIAELKSLCEPADSGQAEVQVLLEENDHLRRRLAELQSAPASAPLHVADPAVVKQLEDLRADKQVLEKLITDKNALIDELRRKSERADGDVDLEAYETELNEFRRDLETDRQKLNAEIEQLRLRNDELEEATREMEMEMSRERAELARERARLERLRDDVKIDLERMQRDGGMSESLAPVQRLRDEMSQRRQGGDGELNDRLRSFRNQLSE